MKIKCLDVVHGTTITGNAYSRAAFRGIGRTGNPYLFLASCPPDYKPGQEYDVNVAFSQNGNYILPY